MVNQDGVKSKFGLVALGVTGTIVAGLFVATNTQIQNILQMCKGRSGRLVDLGSGDGRVILSAIRFLTIENLGEIEYFYHRKCFQKFVYAKTLLKRKTSQDGCQGSNIKLQKSTRKTSQRQSDEATGSRGLFPNICMICKKKELRVKSVRQSLSRIVTDTAERTLKEAAIAHNDLEMMTAVTETDLKAKEFQKHEKCYLDYTRVVRKTAESTEGGNDDKQSGDYNVVLSLVDSDIIGGQQCLSMETLMTRYCGNIGTRQSRHKLKERLTKSFGDQIVFLQLKQNIIFRKW
ncbi:Hypothetical predicted protein [Paramuricea clavata]|uniref:Uncharacterized protein n=1 Tax=Paramuricea clavata TaxID=317549 RepID=A0A6S7FYA4_PARCT|nr:Hypothetical predicted protein [Paramuricea clavata]